MVNINHQKILEVSRSRCEYISLLRKTKDLKDESDDNEVGNVANRWYFFQSGRRRDSHSAH